MMMTLFYFGRAARMKSATHPKHLALRESEYKGKDQLEDPFR